MGLGQLAGSPGDATEEEFQMQRKAGREGRKPPEGRACPTDTVDLEVGTDLPKVQPWATSPGKGDRLHHGHRTPRKRRQCQQIRQHRPPTHPKGAGNMGGGDRMFTTGNTGPSSAPHIDFGRIPRVARGSGDVQSMHPGAGGRPGSSVQTLPRRTSPCLGKRNRKPTRGSGVSGAFLLPQFFQLVRQ